MTVQLDAAPAHRLPALPSILPAPLRPAPARPGLSVTIEVAAESAVLNDELLSTLDDVRDQIAHLGQVTVTVRAAEPYTAPRPQSTSDDADHVRVYPDSRLVRVGAREVALSRLEFDLLLHLAEHPGQVLTRTRLLENVWGDVHVGPRTIDVHVRRVRVKVGARFPLVTTIRGVGYRFDGQGLVSVIRG